jgi:hypothetical protein
MWLAAKFADFDEMNGQGSIINNVFSNLYLVKKTDNSQDNGHMLSRFSRFYRQTSA